MQIDIFTLAKYFTIASLKRTSYLHSTSKQNQIWFLHRQLSSPNTCSALYHLPRCWTALRMVSIRTRVIEQNARRDDAPKVELDTLVSLEAARGWHASWVPPCTELR